jgi:sterol 3beta-glucosyltransferase
MSEQQPPFAQPVVNPEARSPAPKHPVAEAVLNAAAKHVFPESEKHVLPPNRAFNAQSEVSKEGRVEREDDDNVREEREEEPIIGGTPLDEMTPMETPRAGGGGGGGGFPFTRPRKGTYAGTEPTITEGETLVSGPTAGAEEYSVKAVRPGFGAGKEMGSVSITTQLEAAIADTYRSGWVHRR